MSYNKTGKRPAEFASKSSHTHIINDVAVKKFLFACHLPPRSDEVDLAKSQVEQIQDCSDPIKFIIAIDGGYSEVPVRREFPSAQITFFQFGALFFSVADLANISIEPFINPEDMEKLKNLERFKLVIPTKNITYQKNSTITHSVRQALHNFFIDKRGSSSFASTLKWLIYKEFESTPDTVWTLSQCPFCEVRGISLEKSKITDEYTIQCPSCNKTLFLIDIFRLHEAIDDELGAGGVLGYLTVTLEQILLVHIIKAILEIKPLLLKEFLFIKDGPLAFFGQTANLHKPMRSLIGYLISNYGIYLAGLEKSGPFVEHAMEIHKKLKPDSVLILNNEYIYKYIIPGNADPNQPYGKTTYYGNKVIFNSKNGYIYVATLPTMSVLTDPKKDNFYGLDIICKKLSLLKCDMYDSSLFPVALANKLVSLSNHPSAVLLEQFAKQNIK